MARRLLSASYRYVAKNRRCGKGELDLVFLDGKTVVFVEVKTRLGFTADIFSSLNRSQETVLNRTARSYLKSHLITPLPPYRFEVVGVMLCPSDFSVTKVLHEPLNEFPNDQRWW